MTFSESIKTCFGKYVDFSGRASRSEYWWFTLFSVVSQAVVNFIPFIGWIYALALLLPSLAATARRLHDIDRTAWWMLLYLVPVLSLMAIPIMIIVLIGISLSDSGEGNGRSVGNFWLYYHFLDNFQHSVSDSVAHFPGSSRYRGPEPLWPGPPCAKWREWLDSVGRAIITLPRILPERPVHPILIASIFPGRRRKGVPAVGTAPNAGRNCAKGHSSARNAARRCDRGGWMGRRVRTLPRAGCRA